MKLFIHGVEVLAIHCNPNNGIRWSAEYVVTKHTHFFDCSEDISYNAFIGILATKIKEHLEQIK